MSSDVRFSVVIPTYNRSSLLREVIEALIHQENPGCGYEIIPVDNASKDDTRQVVEELAQNSPVPIRYLHEPKPGSHYARNTGFKAAHGEILGLIDDDIIVAPDWVRKIVQAYDNPEVSCAGSKVTIRWVNGSPPKWFEPFKGVLGELDYGHRLIELHYPQMINAGNFSIRKEVLFKVGGYNPCNAPADKLIGDGEGGLCSKVYHSGGRIFWIPDAQGWHIQDAKRITLAYMRRRAKFNGMSNAYSMYRKINGDSFQILKVVSRRIVSTVYNIIWVLQYSNSRGPRFYKHLYTYESNLGFISYLIRIQTNHQLRDLVCRDDWLNV